MNKLYYLLINLLSFFIGCREHTSEAITNTTTSPTYDTVPKTIPIKDPIIGNSIIIDNLEIAQNDFPNKMNWDAAKQACAALGNGWRLPEKFELEMIYENKDKIGGFADNVYWSISEKDFVGNYIAYAHRMGDPFNVGDFWFKKVEFLVRAVRFNTGVAQTSEEIIGKPFKIDNIEVAQNDFRNKMNWDDAKKACAALGNGWRLPTKDEMNILNQNSIYINGFSYGSYWTSTESDDISGAWNQNFSHSKQYNYFKYEQIYVRAVRTL